MTKHIFRLFLVFFGLCFFTVTAQQKKETAEIKVIRDTTKTDVAVIDSLKIYENCSFKLYKKNAHASYYAEKFNGHRTASGQRFYNNKYTAAHRKFPFGTKLKITNEANGKSVIVEVTDRGPFSRGREIDLTRRAFMEIVSNKNSGSVSVTIEVIKVLE